MYKTVINVGNAPEAVGPYSQAIKTGNLLFISGQIPVDPSTGELVTGPVELQMRQVLKNVGAILHSQSLSFENVVKTTLYIRKMDDLGIINEVYGERFQSGPPARACVEVSRLPKDVDVEMDAIAAY